jgi:hypothetical protein
MATWLRQSTSVDVPLGPFLDDTDGKTAETGLTITQPDVRLKKNAGNWAQKAAAQTLTHEENGWYEVTLDATDTNTLGVLVVAVHESGALPVWREFLVVPSQVWDSYLATDLLQVDVTQWLGSAPNALVSGRVDASAGAIASGAITATAIAADAITAAKIADGAIDAATFAAGAIDAAAIATDAIGANELADGAITAATFAAGAIDATAIATDAITAAKIAADAITAAKIADGAIDAATFAAGAIDATAIAANAITSSELADGAITAAKIADGAIDRATFAADTGLQSIRSNTAQAGAAGTITLDASASATDDFYNDALVYLTGGTGAGQVRLVSDYTGSSKVANVTPNWATNPDATSTFALLPSGRVDLALWLGGAPSALAGGLVQTVATLAANSVTSTSIQDGAITAAKIATDAIDADALADGAITAATFAADAITATVIADNAIDAGAIAADAITAAKVAAGTIDAATFAAGAIDAAAIASDAANEIRDAVWAKAMTELSAVPGVTGTTLEALTWAFSLARNKITQDATTQTLFKDDGSTTLATSTHSDSGTLHTRGEFA